MEMSAFENIRIYAQLQPDRASLAHLLGVQAGLPPQTGGRPVTAQAMHMTLIHFGKVQDVYDVIRPICNISYERYAALLQDYIAATEDALPVTPFTVVPKGPALFGEHGGTFVIEYEAPSEMGKVHAQLVQVLQRFLSECGIADVPGFMAQDRNFMHALTLRPHITLYKGYQGKLPAVVLQPVLLRPMPTVYR